MSVRFALLVAVAAGSLWCVAALRADRETADSKSAQGQVYVVEPGPNAEHELLGILIQSLPGDVIELREGTFHFTNELILTTDNITIRGEGPDKTILSFKQQNAGSKGLEATGDAFVLENLAIEDTVGNAVKVVGANGVTFRNVRTEWTGGPKTTNGAYGLYPVQCENVLIDGCVAIGASDAGLYVGQSKNVVVRNSRAEYNVAGIEIENTTNADVYDNIATNNTGGILVFDLPGLDYKNGEHVRVYRNKIVGNNHENFAPEGNIVASVPPGTGMMIMTTDNVEIFENEIRNNQTTSVSIVSFLFTQRPLKDEAYDPFPEGIHIHDNKITDGGKKPSGRIGEMLAPMLGTPLPDVIYDGLVNPAKLKNGKLPAELSVRLANNGDITFANLNFAQWTPENIAKGNIKIDRDLEPFTGKLAALSPVELGPHPAPKYGETADVKYYRSAPEKLSAYGLFEGNGSTQEPVDGVVPYDLNTELFADFTSKYRFIRLPEGEPMTYDGEDVFSFPVGTTIAKTFSMPHDLNDPSKGERLLETRIIERTADGWFGVPYIWNDEQTEATLHLGGGNVDVTWVHDDGSKRTNNYLIPNANQCKSCHVAAETFAPLGPKARNLNKDYDYAHGSENQLTFLSRQNLLKGAPKAEQAPRVPDYRDSGSATVASRARTWLDVNCAHCHNPDGSARTSGLDLRLSQGDPAKIGVWKTPVAAGRGAGGRKYSIVPGKPDESILVYRIASDEPGVMMPELPRRLGAGGALQLVEQWVSQMTETGTRAAAGE